MRPNKLRDALTHAHEHHPDMFDALQKMRRDGKQALIFVQDHRTGEVLCSEDGRSFRPAPPAVRAAVTGKPEQMPGLSNPTTAPKAEVRAMLLALVKRCRPDLSGHPDLGETVEGVIEAIRRPAGRKKFSKLTSNDMRWELIVNAVIFRMNEMVA